MSDPVFFVPSRRFTVAEVAALTGAGLSDPSHADIEISGIASVTEGGTGKLVYADGQRFAPLLAGLNAAAVLCPAELASSVPRQVAALSVARPQAAFAQVARLLFPSAASPRGFTGEIGVSAAAHVDPSAVIEPGATVEAGALVGAGAAIGSGTVVCANAIVAASCQIGRDCYIGPSAVVECALLGNRVVIHGGAMIGRAGFGFVGGRDGPERIPQIGRVVIQDNVEIGANTTVDRGAIGDTVIGEGTKIDNLVQVAHNVRIGRGCIIAGHCGLSGSVVLGDNVMLGGRVGIADHMVVGSGAQIGAAAGVMNDIPPGERWVGSPAVPMREFFRQVAAMRAMGRKGKGGADD